uniref:Variant surface glycoprotein 1125.4147 n=1 Tax=Trypanosoma brucei TaxID=5691 RepID=A0A1J0RA49_9TRYP|nr:variant surface glycoprotein 1125.4147 [Trypanosoma brucei]
MGKIVGIVLGLLVIADTLRSGHAAGTYGVKKASWQPLCEATTDLTAVPSDVAANLKAGAAKVKNMILDSTRAAIYSQLQKGTKEAARAITISLYMLGAALRAVSYLESTDIINGVDLAAKSAYLKGHIDEFLKVAEKTTRSGEHCLLAAGDTGAATFAGESLNSVNCPTTMADTTPTKTSLKKLSSKGHKGAMTPSNGGSHEHQASGTYRCRLFSKSNANGLAHSGGNVEDGITWAGGYYSLHSTPDNPLTVADLRETPDTPREASTAWQQVFTAISKAPNSESATYANNSKAIDSDTEATELLSQVLHNEKGENAEDIKKMRDDIFTSDLAKVVDATFANIHNAKLPAKIAGINKGKSLGEITAPSDLAALLAALLLQTDTEIVELKKKLETTNERPDTVTETTCNTIKGEADCNRTAACSYNTTETYENKKCQFNASKASASGVPAPQPQTGGTETTTEKCKGKGEKDCKSPDCKWDGKECKDFSFLVNMKLALSIAAFMSLVAF